MRARTSLAALVTLVAGALAQQKSPEDAQIKEGIEKLFQGRGEAVVRDGANILLRVGNQKAIEPLLKMLSGPQPHYRDIVWEVLPAFTDPYARRRVEQELKTNRKNEHVREWCAELLGLYADAAFASTLMAALADESVLVQRAATRSLGKIAHKAAWPPVERLLAKKDPHLRELAFEALARIDPEKGRPKVVLGLQDPDAGVRCALLGALPALYPDLVAASSLAALADPDWRPRMQAVENLATVKSKDAVAALITALEDGRPVVAERAREMLTKVTGQKLWLRPQWEAWWRDHAATFDFTGAASRPDPAGSRSANRTVSTYHGIDITSDHVAFLVDRTKDMDAQLRSKGATKERAALEELRTVLDALAGRLTFNVFAYADAAQPFRPKPLALDKKVAAAALEFVTKTRLPGNKDIWNVLESVVADPTLDTVFLLSSGEPEVGTYVHWNRVTAQLAELNRFHKVTVHTVAYSDSKWYRDQLEKIAEVTGGKFRWFE